MTEQKEYLECEKRWVFALLIFVAGALVAAVLCGICGGYTILVTLIPLVILFADLLHADRTKERGKLDVTPEGH